MSTIPVRFTSGGKACLGDLHLPEDSGHEGKFPVVVLAHGIGAERRFGLAPFARDFARRGLAALVFDYRHLGESEGEPRGLVDPRQQIEDYFSALAFVRRHPELDGDRIGLWGTSFSGGHVLEVAARRPHGVRAVVSQIPFVSGWASTFAYPLRYHLPAIGAGLLDRLLGLLGRAPVTVPVTRERGFALLASPDSHEGYRAMVPEDSEWSGRVPARVFLEILRYHPGRAAPRIRAPTLVVGATEDAVCPIAATRKVVERIRDVHFETLPVGHFDPYRGEWFDQVVALEGEFLARHLVE